MHRSPASVLAFLLCRWVTCSYLALLGAVLSLLIFLLLRGGLAPGVEFGASYSCVVVGESFGEAERFRHEIKVGIHS